MMRNKILYILFILLWGCKREQPLLEYDKYSEWIRNPENGLHQIKKVQNLIISLQLLPEDYLKNRTYGALNYDYDSVAYANQLTFSLKIDVDRAKSINADPFYVNATSFDEVEERKKLFANMIENNFNITHGIVSKKPVICVEDITNGLIAGKSVLLAFDVSKEDIKSGFELTWNDIVFRTGIHKFTYSSEVLRYIPRLIKSQK